MPQIREPKKGQGVPKETRNQNSIAALQQALINGYPGTSWNGLEKELEQRGFFDAGMQQQVRIMAETSAMLVPSENKSTLISSLAASPVEKVRGIAAFAVPELYPEDLDAQLRELYVTGALDGTWPRELSATILHGLIIEHGVLKIRLGVQGWTADSNPAVRRLVAESFRPRGVMLAHIQELKIDPSPLHDLLQPLLDDNSDYVRKAVANNLNDVSKNNPDVILDWAREWLTPGSSEERRWVINRALRTLVAEGDPSALRLLGYAPGSELDVTWRATTPSVLEINQLIPFRVDIANRTKKEALVLLLLHMDEPGKGTGRRRSKYHLWRGKIPPGGSKQVAKSVHFVDKSRQPKEEGTYRLLLSANGVIVEERPMVFERR